MRLLSRVTSAPSRGPRAAPERSTIAARRYVPTAVVAVAAFAIAYDGGSYDLSARTTLAIAGWWVLIITLALGVWPRAPIPFAAVAAGAFLCAFALHTALSMAWAESAEKAFVEFNRVSLYVSAFVIAVVAASRRGAGRWADALALGIGAIGLVALASRLFPDVFPPGELLTFLPGLRRLSFPLGYWNGLAIFLAVGVPLLLRTVLVAQSRLAAAVAAASVPALACAVFLTSSRGGVAAAVVGTIAFVAASGRPFIAAATVVAEGVGAAAAIAVLLRADAVVNAPIGSPEAVEEGRVAAVAIAGIGVAAGAAIAFGLRAVRHRAFPRVADRAALGAIAAVTVVGFVAADPVARYEGFKERPPRPETQDYVQSHLLSASGSGRWQYWTAAVDQFQDRPLIGHGAGSFEAWWAEHGTIQAFIRDAHSLYLETLGELGLVGFAFLAGAFATGSVAAVRRLRRHAGDERVTVAAIAASFAAYVLGAGIDWVWELPAVSLVGITLLGLLVGPATAAAPRPQVVGEADIPRVALRGGATRFTTGIALLALMWLALCTQAISLLSTLEIQNSRDALARGEVETALTNALDARDIQPWAASPYLQLALVAEEAGDLPAAREWLADAIERDQRDWRLWLVSARIETKSGAIAAAGESLRRARALNPRSPIFAGAP